METQFDVTVNGDTIWLTQRQIAELFGTKVPAISKHLKNSSTFLWAYKCSIATFLWAYKCDSTTFL